VADEQKQQLRSMDENNVKELIKEASIPLLTAQWKLGNDK